MLHHWKRKIAGEVAGPKRYVGSWEKHLAIRLRFYSWLRSGPAGLFEDNTSMWIGGGGQMCTLYSGGKFHKICTSQWLHMQAVFEPSRIA